MLLITRIYYYFCNTSIAQMAFYVLYSVKKLITHSSLYILILLL